MEGGSVINCKYYDVVHLMRTFYPLQVGIHCMHWWPCSLQCRPGAKDRLEISSTPNLYVSVRSIDWKRTEIHVRC